MLFAKQFAALDHCIFGSCLIVLSFAPLRPKLMSNWNAISRFVEVSGWFGVTKQIFLFVWNFLSWWVKHFPTNGSTFDWWRFAQQMGQWPHMWNTQKCLPMFPTLRQHKLALHIQNWAPFGLASFNWQFSFWSWESDLCWDWLWKGWLALTFLCFALLKRVRRRGTPQDQFSLHAMHDKSTALTLWKPHKLWLRPSMTCKFSLIFSVPANARFQADTSFWPFLMHMKMTVHSCKSRTDSQCVLFVGNGGGSFQISALHGAPWQQWGRQVEDHVKKVVGGRGCCCRPQTDRRSGTGKILHSIHRRSPISLDIFVGQNWQILVSESTWMRGLFVGLLDDCCVGAVCIEKSWVAFGFLSATRAFRVFSFK